jgi:hypothetical protein
VTCPAGTVVWGGGVSFVNVHLGLGLTVNTSEPMESTGWEARVNNTTTSAAQFAVEAVCANKPKGYQQLFRAVDNPAGSQSHATAICPSPKVVLGGGTLSTSDQAAAVLTSAWPSGSDKFKGYLYNGTTADASLTVYAICGNKPTGYTTASDSTPAGPDATLLDLVGCPAGTSALDAGGQTVGRSPLVLVNGLIDQNASSWVLFMDNTAPSDQEIVGHVTCAA